MFVTQYNLVTTWLMTQSSLVMDWVFVAVVLSINMFFYEDTPRKGNYIAKSKRSLLSRKAFEYCGILKSWIKPSWDRLDNKVYTMKTKRRRHPDYFTTFHKRRKKYKLLPACAIVAMVNPMGHDEDEQNESQSNDQSNEDETSSDYRDSPLMTDLN
jgi:hypothetical protein